MKYKCLKCGDLINSGMYPLSRCPIPGCNGDLRLQEQYFIRVRECGQTYIARANGRTASCTAAPQQAACRVAKKIFGDRPFALAMLADSLYEAAETTTKKEE